LGQRASGLDGLPNGIKKETSPQSEHSFLSFAWSLDVFTNTLKIVATILLIGLFTNSGRRLKNVRIIFST
jgi:hypothetical protein